MDEHRRSTAAHEAGHVVAAIRSGALVLSASSRVLVPAVGGWAVVFDRGLDAPERAGILMAGSLAEWLLADWTPTEPVEEVEPWFTDEEIRVGARVWSSLIADEAAVRALDLRRGVLNEVRGRTASLLARHRDEVERVAELLHRRGVVSGNQILEVIA